MTHIEMLLRRARREWRRDGVLSTSLVMQLLNAGIDVVALEHRLEREEW